MKTMILGFIIVSCSGAFATPDKNSEFAQGGGPTQVGGGAETTKDKILSKKQEALKVMDWAIAKNQSELAQRVYKQVRSKISLMNLEMIPTEKRSEYCGDTEMNFPVTHDLHKTDHVYVCEVMVRGQEDKIIQELIQIAAKESGAGRTMDLNANCGAWKLSYSVMNDAGLGSKSRRNPIPFEPGVCQNDSVDYVIAGKK